MKRPEAFNEEIVLLMKSCYGLCLAALQW